jgi:uncharacterized ferredoxin-like protein
MTLIIEEKHRKRALLEAAQQMMTAARTAPKARGIDNIEICCVDGVEIERIADKMVEISERAKAYAGFYRDAGNILQSEVIVLIGTKISSIGLSYCGLCGFKNCDEKNKHPEHPCSFNTGDLGIAVGSAVSRAMDLRVDNRIMYSVGMAVKELGIFGKDVKIILGIPLSCSSKNIFFDRKQ